MKKIKKLNRLISEISTELLDYFNSNGNSTVIRYKNGNLIGNFESIFCHKGLYGFLIEKDNQSLIAYIGKSEGDDRIRQHLTGKNKTNDQPLAKSVKTKHKEIQKAIASGFTVRICLFTDVDFQKPSLSCIESDLIIKSKDDFSRAFPNETHWNQRIG